MIFTNQTNGTTSACRTISISVDIIWENHEYLGIISDYNIIMHG